MRGRTLVTGFLAFVALFFAGLVWTQFFAYYEREQDIGALSIMGEDGPRRRLPTASLPPPPRSSSAAA